LTDANDNAEIDFERINILYDSTKYGYLGVLGAASFFTFTVWELASPALAIIWLSALIAAYIPRIILSYLFFVKSARDEIDKSNVKRWEDYFLLHSILPFLAFSAAVFIAFGEDTFGAVLFYAAITMTLLAGAMLSYSIALSVLMLFTHLLLVPLVVKCIWMQTDLFNVLGAALIFAYLLFSRLIPRQHNMLLENISLKIESERRSITDPLTQLGNRRLLEFRIKDIVAASRRSKEPFSIILLDVDYFKKYNDTYGHADGDELLVKLSKILVDCSRDQDLVIRYGGEEFLLVLPRTDVHQAIFVVDRISSRIQQETKVTISAGIAMHAEDDEFEHLLRSADRAFYDAKKGGRNQYKLALDS